MTHKKIEMSHLHMHSTYSVLDSVSKIPNIVKRLKEFDHKSALLSDHGTIAGCVAFYDECKKQGIKPILGCEFYYMPDPAKAKEEKSRLNHHLILMAMDQEGWTNIRKLTTRANEQFYYAPRIGLEDLKNHSNGLICLTACLKGIVPYNISEQKYDEAFKHAELFKGIFGDRFYLEVQDGGLDIQITVNEVMRRMAQKLDVKVVACQDAHYVDRDDVEAHEGIWALRTYNTFDDPVGYGPRDDMEGQKVRPYYSTREYWLKDAWHMLHEPLTTEKGVQRASTLLQSEVEESARIADRIGDVVIEKKMHLPKYEFVQDISQGGCASDCNKEAPSSFDYLCELITQGYEKVYERSWLDRTEEHRQRLNTEIADIKDAGLADYFLIIWDITSWVRANNIPLGAGRGSAAGSMVSFCLGITSIDPLKYGLIWERFYNAGRKGSMPDIDVDVGKIDRPRVVEYIKARFGVDRVAQIVTFNTLKSKAAIKDSARILGKQGGMAHEDANVVTRAIPMEHAQPVSLKKALEKSDRLVEYADKYPRLFKMAQKLEGCPKSRGVHPAGLVICDVPFSEGFPLRWNPKEECLVTEYDMKTLDDLQYIKVDCLGIQTLDCLKYIEDKVNGE